MCLVAFQKIFRKIFSDVWLCSWKYHRKHIFYLLLTFSWLPNEYIILFIPQNTNKTQKKIIKSGQTKARSRSERSRSARSWSERSAHRDQWQSENVFSPSLCVLQDPEMNWSENEGRNSFPWSKWKFRSTGNHFPENNVFRDSQTHAFSGNWFLKLVFRRFKRSLRE